MSIVAKRVASCPLRRRRLGVAAWLLWPIASRAAEPAADYPIRPVPFTAVRVTDGFWAPRLETNRQVTIPYDFAKCEETGRIDNFAKAGGLMPGKFRGIFYDDSDVFKVIEGASYSLALHPDPKLAEYLDELIAKIAAAQEDDGYLYTARTIDPQHPPAGSGPKRWSRLKFSHELYNAGHLYEAAVAHHLATGKRTLLDVALRNAELIVATFAPDKLRAVPGHQEIEIGLCKLYRVTGDRRYLDQARFFLDQRGRADGRELYGAYAQDHAPVLDQAEAVGHAVRAAYMYCGLADVAALSGDPSYLAAVDRLWDDVVGRKLYLTGGLGARREGEAFGEPYELPNREAYAETCAAIAGALWNHRMFLLHGDAKYIDVLERTIYNGFLAGVGLSGDRFFYPNPLACDGRTKFNQGDLVRQPWFDCACCPVNDVRFLPSIAGCIYAVGPASQPNAGAGRGESTPILYVNLYLDSQASIDAPGGDVTIRQTGSGPWGREFRPTIELQLAEPRDMTVALRVPGWALGRPVPSDLYRYVDAEPSGQVTITVDGARQPFEIKRGYARLRRLWRNRDTITLQAPMPVRQVRAHERVAADRGRAAFERGPIVYCAEGVDHGGGVFDLVVDPESSFQIEHRPDLLGGVTLLSGRAQRVQRDGQGLRLSPVELTLVPYYAWCHRGPTEMAVWLPIDPARVEPPPPPTLASRSRASASHCNPTDTLEALHDRLEPQKSHDHDLPRFTWWDRRGTREWVQYDLPEKARVRGVEVYWFDDEFTGGACRLPKSWRVEARRGGQWRDVPGPPPAPVKDRYNAYAFGPLEADALRIDVELQPDYSGGILEWKVIE